MVRDDDAERLATDGVVVIDGFLGGDAARAARAELIALLQGGALRPARVGHGARAVRAEQIRSDHICWLRDDNERDDDGRRDGVAPGPALRRYRDALKAASAVIARSCFVSLRHVELHVACYEPDAAYAAHKDTFVDDARRVISACYYLNEGWTPDDGGCLRLHADPPRDVAPVLDRLVLFRSATTVHEVLKARRQRLSVTGWLGASPGR